MKYVIMCGGDYVKWEKPKHLTQINGEALVERTIRLLRSCGVSDIAISSNNPLFELYDVPVLKHQNDYCLDWESSHGNWLDCFYPSEEPICYIFGDVVFSPDAIRTIVNYKTDGIMFFASAEPLPSPNIYCKPWAEPFAYKVVDTKRFFDSIKKCLEYEKNGCFYRQPVSWELWQVIQKTPLNIIDYTNYVAINDYTCDIDEPDDIKYFEGVIND